MKFSRIQASPKAPDWRKWRSPISSFNVLRPEMVVQGRAKSVNCHIQSLGLGLCIRSIKDTLLFYQSAAAIVGRSPMQMELI